MSAAHDEQSATQSCAIVVTHYPERAVLLKLLSQINKETDFLVIDNCSPDADRYRQSILAYPRCVGCRQLDENVGLAEALNLGLEDVRGRGYRFALLFDQDSGLSDLYVESLVAAYHQAAALSPQKVAAVGPRIINPHSLRQMPFKLFNRLVRRSDLPIAGAADLFRADFLITSGTLIALNVLEEIGVMKSSYFIDNVDLEWCFRARARGYALVGTDQAILYHAIGERSSSPLVRKGLIAQHSPARTYYSSRNRVHLYRTPYAPWGWKVRDCVRFLFKTIWLLLMSDQRWQYWQNIRRGVIDSRALK